MPVTSHIPTLVAFPAVRARRLPSRPAPARAAPETARRSQAPAAVQDGRGLVRTAMGAGIGAVLLALAGLGGWGLVAVEGQVQASLAGYVTSSAPAGGVAGRGASMSWDRR